MGLYNFKAQFEAPILAGTKRHTIRALRKHPDKPGSIMHLYVGLRHPGARLLAKATCVKVDEILIAGECPQSKELLSGIWVNGNLLDFGECELLAKSDGFSSFAEMMEFWRGRLPFEGHIYHWRKLEGAV